MARGRELAAQKVTGQKRNDMRWKEVAEGKPSLSRDPRTLYVLTRTGFDASSGKVSDPTCCTAGTHIMINPPKK